MNGFKEFDYSAEQWDSIVAIIAKMRRSKKRRAIIRRVDADRIGRGGPSVRVRIAVEAGVFCDQGLLNRRAAERQARIDNLIALRDNLQSHVVPMLAITSGVDTANMLDATETFIVELTRRINFSELLAASRLPDERAGNATGNAAKTGRQRFWNELLAIWTEIGGQETGADAARFLIAASQPAFDFMRGDADACNKDRAIPDQRSVEQWLRRRQRAAR